MSCVFSSNCLYADWYISVEMICLMYESCLDICIQIGYNLSSIYANLPQGSEYLL